MSPIFSTDELELHMNTMNAWYTMQIDRAQHCVLQLVEENIFNCAKAIFVFISTSKNTMPDSQFL